MISEKIIVGEGTEYPLNGLLTLPEGEGPFPAVVFVHGSGASNMDEKINSCFYLRLFRKYQAPAAVLSNASNTTISAVFDEDFSG